MATTALVTPDIEDRIPPSVETKPRVGKLTDDDIVDQIRRLRQESIDRNSRIMDVALSCWEQYRNKQNFDNKADWESRITLAKAHAAVKHAVANILRMLTQAEQWVNVEDVGEGPLNPIASAVGIQSFAPYVERGVLKVAELAEFKETLRDSLEYGFATMFGAMKVIWQQTPVHHSTIEQNEKGMVLRQREIMQGRLGLYSLDPWKVHFGPNTKGGGKSIDYIVEDSDADIAILKSLGGFENLDSFVDRDQEAKDRTDPYADARKDIATSGIDSRVRRRIELWDYWGDLIDPKTQEVVARNMHIIVGNGEKIIKFQENPLWDKLPPYILFSPLIVAGRFPGGGILEMNLEIKKAIDRIAQMWEDHLHFSVLPMWEAELAALENPEDVMTGVMPGKVFRKKMGQGPNQIFRPLEVRPLTAESFNAVLAYNNEYQRGTFITEQTQGLIDARGETTATEVQQTAIASTLILADIAAHLEAECLAPLGEKIWDRMFQFVDATSRPSWSQLIGVGLGQILDQLPVEARMEIVRGDYVFKARGLSRVIERQASRNQLIQYVQTIGQLGPAQILLNLPEIFQRVHHSFHMPEPDKLLAPNWQQVFLQLQAAMLAQMNPLLQQQMKNEAQAEKLQAQAQEAATVETIRAEGAMMREGVKSILGRENKGDKNGN